MSSPFIRCQRAIDVGADHLVQGVDAGLAVGVGDRGRQVEAVRHGRSPRDRGDGRGAARWARRAGRARRPPPAGPWLRTGRSGAAGASPSSSRVAPLADDAGRGERRSSAEDPHRSARHAPMAALGGRKRWSGKHGSGRGMKPLRGAAHRPDRDLRVEGLRQHAAFRAPWPACPTRCEGPARR